MSGLCSPLSAAPSYRATTPQDPITKLTGLASTAEFTGDEPDPNHERFWNVDGYIQKCGGIPVPSEQQNVVIVGGGLSGLIAGYHLKKLKPLILEQASQFGGNSKGETINSSYYSLGPAYISIPEQNSASHRMLNDIGVLKYARLETAADKEVFLNGKVLPKFWSGQHEDAKVFAQMKQLLKGFESNASNFNSMTVNQWIQRNFPQITTTLYEYFQYYAWSSFGATLDEVAAGEFFSWQASEQHGVMVFPGGNSLIAQSLYQNLVASVGPTQMRTKSAVLKVIPGNGFVDVVVEESLNKLKTIRTKFVIMAAPKFVAKRIITNIPAAQMQSMNNIEYRSFMVGNVTLRRNIPSKGYDLYCLKKEVPKTPSSAAPFTKGFTDVIFANWAQGDKGSPCTLTFYKSFPYQGARQFLLNPFAHNKHRDYMLADLQAYFPELGITASDIAAVRMTLWGHSVPVCRAQFASSPQLALASQPVGNVLFANQDNYISPSYESAETSAVKAAATILKNFR
tara:strand:+ start:31717 stop:33249 length:1533 start_codon:yes stop_codon:yes gene_type:complete